MIDKLGGMKHNQQTFSRDKLFRIHRTVSTLVNIVLLLRLTSPGAACLKWVVGLGPRSNVHTHPLAFAHVANGSRGNGSAIVLGFKHGGNRAAPMENARRAIRSRNGQGAIDDGR
jgi:hypothetical protein